jgi:hypothetical protein
MILVGVQTSRGGRLSVASGALVRGDVCLSCGHTAREERKWVSIVSPAVDAFVRGMCWLAGKSTGSFIEQWSCGVHSPNFST